MPVLFLAGGGRRTRSGGSMIGGGQTGTAVGAQGHEGEADEGPGKEELSGHVVGNGQQQGHAKRDGDDDSDQGACDHAGQSPA